MNRKIVLLCFLLVTIIVNVKAVPLDIDLYLLTPNGEPIADASVALEGESTPFFQDLGYTDSSGKIMINQVPSGNSYSVIAYWYGYDISPVDPISITTELTYRSVATNVATLTVQCVGARGQSLPSARVTIWLRYNSTHGWDFFDGTADGEGRLSIAVPCSSSVDITVDYKGFQNTASIDDISRQGESLTIATNVFLEIFGQTMTFATFVLWIVLIIVILVLVIAYTWRRRRSPKLSEILPPPPPPPP